MVDRLQKRDSVARAAADIEDLAGVIVDLPRGQFPGVEQVVDEEHVPELPAVAVDHDRLPCDGGDREPCQPTLILDAELALPVDARLSHDNRPQTVDFGIIPD